MKQKKKKVVSRSSASFSQKNVHSDKLSAYKESSLPSTIMKTSTDTPSRADTELSRLTNKDVFRSSPNAIKKSNSNPRRVR